MRFIDTGLHHLFHDCLRWQVNEQRRVTFVELRFIISQFVESCSDDGVLRHQLQLLVRFSGFIGVEPADLFEIVDQVEGLFRARRLFFLRFLCRGPTLFELLKLSLEGELLTGSFAFLEASFHGVCEDFGGSGRLNGILTQRANSVGPGELGERVLLEEPLGVLPHEVEFALEDFQQFVLVATRRVHVPPLEKGNRMLHLTCGEVSLQEQLSQLLVYRANVLRDVFHHFLGVLFRADFDEPFRGNFLPQLDESLRPGLSLEDLVAEAGFHELEEHPASQVLCGHTLAVQVFPHERQENLSGGSPFSGVFFDQRDESHGLSDLVFEDLIQSLVLLHS